MTKQELILNFIRNHEEAIRYTDSLNEQEFMHRYGSKWTAGQHLEHILLTIVPFPGALASKAFILEKFGTIDRLPWDYETVLENYAGTSLKAPDRFVPAEEVELSRKSGIMAGIREEIGKIGELLSNYSEEELDTLTLPHPLLGQLTIREMFYLMGYHPQHHQRQVESMLGERS